MIGTLTTKQISQATVLILEKANDCMRRAALPWLWE